MQESYPSANPQSYFEGVCSDAIAHYGLDQQLNILQEECGELVAAVSHFRRSRDGSRAGLVTELADVIIMTHQICMAIGDEDVDLEVRKKLGRLVERMGKDRLEELDDIQRGLDAR